MDVSIMVTIAPENMAKVERAFRLAGLAPPSTDRLVDVDHDYDNHAFHCNPVHYGDELTELVNGANAALAEMRVAPQLPEPNGLDLVQKAALLALLNREFLWKTTTDAAEMWWAKDAGDNLQGAWNAALDRYPEIFQRREPTPQLPDPALGTPSARAAVAAMLASLQDDNHNEAPSMFLEDAERLLTRDEQIVNACAEVMGNSTLNHRTQVDMWEEHHFLGQALQERLNEGKTESLRKLVNTDQQA